MIARPPTQRTGTDVLRAAGTLAWTTAIVVAAPLLLAHFFGYPLPRQIPDWGEVLSTPMQLVEPQVILNVFVCLGWVMWAIVVAYVFVDLVDLARGVGHRVRRLGPASVVAGKLVASIALLVSLLRPQPVATPSGARPAPTEQVLDVTTTAAAALPANIVLVRADPTGPITLPPVVPSTESVSPAPTYTVKRGDSLWRIAEQQLGSGFRWREIHELNHPVIANPDLICTGWILTLPADALAPDPAPAAPDTAAMPPTEPAPDTPSVPPPTTPIAPPSTPAPTPGPAATEPAAPGPSAPGPTALPPPTAPPSTASQNEPTTNAPVATSSPASTDPAASTEAPSSTLPLALRAQGFDTQADYDNWLAQQQPPSDEHSPLARDGIIAGAAAIPTLLAAALVAAVDRRRRRVLQRRPIHAELPPRNRALQPTEARLRAESLTDPTRQVAWIDVVLRLLALAFHAQPTDSQLLIVQAGTFGIELLWDRPTTLNPPEGFSASSDGQSWLYRCGDPGTLTDLQGELAGVTHHIHALVSLGDTADGPILVNLQALDAIDLDGDPTAVRQWLAAVILELEAHRWAEAVDTAISTPTTLPTRLTTSIHIDDDGHGRPLVWRSDRTEPGAPWQLTITEAATHLRNDEIGLAIDLHPVGVDDDLFTAASALLTDAAHDPYGPGPEGGEPPAPAPPLDDGPDEHQPAANDDRPPEPERGRAPALSPEHETSVESDPTVTGTLLLETPAIEPITDFTADALLVIRVLGPVRSEGWHKTPKSPRTEDIVTYLAMARPDSVSRDRLIDALWNGKDVSTKLLFNYIGTLRKELGDQAAVAARDGSYVIDDAIRSDWEHFQRLVRQADNQPWSVRRAVLSAALSLVYGRPFDDTERFGWAATDGTLSRIEVAVTDTATELATEALREADPAMAIWAARRGLLACPWHVRLYGYILQAHVEAGDTAALEHTWRELQRAAGDDGVPSEMTDLYVARR